MVYTNTKLNLTYCQYHKYGSDTIYRKRYTIQKKYSIIVQRNLAYSDSGCGYCKAIKSNNGILEYNRTKI